MSEDGFSSDCFEEPNMEIQIDTLLGTSFDMRCSSTDTVREIKQRIQRVEGIPVHQQNLIFQSNELKDSRRLCDAGIRNGSTIRLVTTMKGGPISTRRLSVSCEHHMVIKELKELLENTRDEVGDKLTPGAKVSVLVFKEGDILNLLRVIENEDGSYSPYSEKPISPPAKPARKDAHLAMFEKLVEDTDMMTKISNLRKKMEDVSLRKQKRHGGRHNNNNNAAGSSSSSSGTNNFERTSHFISSKLRTGGLSFYRRNLNLDELAQSSGSSSSSSLITNTDEFVAGGGGGSRNHHGGNVSYKLLAECTNDMLDNIDLKIFEKNLDDGHSETEEIALKDKHRIKPQRKSSSHNRSLYSKSKGALSLTKQSYARIHKRTRDLRDLDSAAYAAFGMRETKIEENDDYEEDEDEYCDEDEDNELFVDPTEELLLPASYNSNEPLVTASCVSTGKQKKNIHLTRLVLTTTDGVLDHHHHHRPKSSPTTSAETIVDSLELEESAAQDLWEIHESSSAADRLKHCNFGVLKRRQSLDYSAYDDLVDQPSTSTATKKLQQHDLCSEEYDYCNEALCSGGNIFHMPHLVSPTATCGGIPVSSNAHGGASVNTIPQEQFMSNTGKNSNSDDYFLSGGGSTAGSKNGRSPLYGRTKTEDLLGTASSGVGSTGRSKLPEIKTNVGSGTSEVTSATKYSFLSGDCASTIQRLKNDCCHSNNNNNNNNGEPSSSSVKSSDNLVFDSTDENPAATNSSTITNSATSATITNNSSGVGGLDKIYGYYNLAISGGSTSGAQDFLGEKVLHQKRDYATRPLNRNSLGHQLHHRELEVLPPVIQKKKARCSECNKRLNITNIYNCRCGRVFCSQHRYSEVHGCTYDYKTEGRRILEHQNPLVTAEKVNRI